MYLLEFVIEIKEKDGRSEAIAPWSRELLSSQIIP